MVERMGHFVIYVVYVEDAPRNDMLTAGIQAKNFSLPDETGRMHSLADYRGAWLLLYFYPKDDTPGCTKEACMLRDDFPQFQSLDAAVLGVSADSVESHCAFKNKYNIPFHLLSDPEKATINAYGAWGRKKFMGKEYEGILRTSYLIDPEGKIAKVYESVKPLEHAGEVLRDLEELRRA